MSEKTVPDISIIIVNYKVKEYVKGLLDSIVKAGRNFELEIFVIDNDSGDDSSAFLKKYYPDVYYINNQKNIGFGRANNQAIRLAKGKYTFIINPDTVINEDLFTVMTDHMENNPYCGAAGVKILNPDGTYAPESKRSVPTIWSSFCKMFSLHELLPDKKLFNQYYLSWLDEDQINEVPVLSGSCMFWRTKLLKDLSGFDERFFMYGEDIDLCYRVQDTDFHIDYVPKTSIIHYKGESTKKGDLRYNWIFNKALYQFYDKHYSTKYSLFFKGFIYLAIWVKTISSEVGGLFRSEKNTSTTS